MTEFRTWYDSLVKPSWTPQPSTIGTIWAIIYPLIAIAAIGTVVKVVRGDLPRLVLRAARDQPRWRTSRSRPIQFGLRNLPLATFDILVVLVTIVWWMALVWRPGSAVDRRSRSRRICSGSRPQACCRSASRLANRG